MKVLETGDAFEEETKDTRNRRGNEHQDAKKRANTKESKIRAEKIEKKQKQREETLAARSPDEKLEMDIDEDSLKKPKRTRNQKAKQADNQKRKAENQDIYINEFIENIVGKKPESAGGRASVIYKNRVEAAFIPGYKKVEKIDRLREELEKKD